MDLNNTNITKATVTITLADEREITYTIDKPTGVIINAKDNLKDLDLYALTHMPPATSYDLSFEFSNTLSYTVALNIVEKDD